jgi:hypothetical protein
MKKLLFILICVSVINVALAVGNILENFKGTVSSDVVDIEWRTNSETNIARFEIERFTSSGFKAIGIQKANGKPSSYKFTDSDSFYKVTVENELQANNIATYRLKICYSSADAPTYSEEITVTRGMSSIKRTLGMLKEMFK